MTAKEQQPCRDNKTMLLEDYSRLNVALCDTPHGFGELYATVGGYMRRREVSEITHPREVKFHA